MTVQGELLSDDERRKVEELIEQEEGGVHKFAGWWGKTLTFIAFLPPLPIKAEPPFLSFEWLWSGFTVMPIQMFNWTSRPDPAFHHNAAAAGLVLVVMTLSMNALAIYIRYRLRKNIKW